MIGKTFAERSAAVAPYVGARCTITFGQFDRRTLTGTVVGVAHHATNGNSTGDLILAGGWNTGGDHHDLVSIALARVHNIERA